MKLLTAFYPQIDEQTERINQELEQCLRFFINHKQKNWPEQLVSAEFVINNKVHSITKISPFIANYGKELKMGINIRIKEKMEKATEFAKRMKKVQKKTKAILKRA